MIRLFVFFSITITTHAAGISKPLFFTGTCDASAAITIDDDLFAVANDEDNVLRFYRLSRPGDPVHSSNLNTLLFNKKKSPEMDIEGVTRLGQYIFWITSHGRKSGGDPAPNRARLFALDVTNRGSDIVVQSVGNFYGDLLNDLSREPKLARFRLSEGSRKAPKSGGGLNIEGLAATPYGALLIGFRNPIPERRALIVPLLNPNEVLRGRSAKFGDPIQLDLGGLGLRGMESVKNGYYLLAGPADGNAQSRLFFWKGGVSIPQVVSGIEFPSFNPEAICLRNEAAGSDLLLLSDDGTREMNGEDCKDLPESQRQFRAYHLTP